MINRYAVKKFDEVIFNVEGPHHEQFPLDYYNQIIAKDEKSQIMLDLLNNEINQVDSFAKEYNRQSIEHASKGNYNDSAIAASWRKTAIDVLGELGEKKNKLAAWLRNPRNQALTSNDAVFNPFPQQTSVDLSGGLGTVNVASNIGTGTGKPKGKKEHDFNKPKLDVGTGGKSTASIGKNILGTILIVGLVLGAIKFMK